MNYQAVFKQWMTEHEGMLRHIIAGFEAKPALQDELMQDIALNIWQAIPKFKGQSAVKTFVARIAHNILATHVAKAVRTVKESQELAPDADIAAQDATPYEELNQSQRQQRLIQAIRRLKLEQQQVITLALEGMSYKEIAETLSISTNLAGVRLKRAKQRLTELLETP